MKTIASQFSRLKESLEVVAFLVSKGTYEKEAHSKIVQSLVLLAQIETEVYDLLNTQAVSLADNPEPKITPSLAAPNDRISCSNNKENNAAIEIAKVRRRVPRWFKNPSQYNSTILNAFLELYDQQNQVAVQMLRNKCQTVNDFEGNYNQMKNFGEKNHGKVFEETNGIVTLWKPVKEFILELYKSQKV